MNQNLRIQLALLKSAAFCIFFSHFSVLAASNSAMSSKAASRCKSLSLFDLKVSESDGNSLSSFYERFEAAFKNNDSKAFKELIHPSMTREAKSSNIFSSTVDDFGLSKVTISRSFAFLVDLLDSKSQSVDCDTGIVRGVVGPTEQVAMVHQYLSGNEQVRLFTLATKVPPAFRKIRANEWGLVMMHAQTWTHGKQTASSLRKEADKWNLLGEPVTAWALSKASRLILEANPYFESNELAESVRQETAFAQQKPKVTELSELTKALNLDWIFEDVTVVFQANGLEMGLKVRMPKTEIPVNEQIDTCKKIGRAFAQKYPGVVRRFTGFECLTYLPSENINSISESGSQFHRWDRS